MAIFFAFIINFNDNSFDLVISLAVLEHLKNPDLFLHGLSTKNMDFFWRLGQTQP